MPSSLQSFKRLHGPGPRAAEMPPLGDPAEGPAPRPGSPGLPCSPQLYSILTALGATSPRPWLSEQLPPKGRGPRLLIPVACRGAAQAPVRARATRHRDGRARVCCFCPTSGAKTLPCPSPAAPSPAERDARSTHQRKRQRVSKRVLDWTPTAPARSGPAALSSALLP